MIKIVNIKLDKDGKTFRTSVHRELLCFYSPYYTAALKGVFSEAKKDTVTLDLSSDQMADLISWLYSGTMISKNKTDMMELYVFADEKMMLALRRSIMTRYLSLDDAGYINLNSDETVSLIHRLPSNSGLFRYFVDYWTYSWIQISGNCDLERWDRDGRIPRAFFYQALKRCVKGAVCELSSPDSTYACNYHEHINGDEWESSCGDVQENTFIPNVQRPSHAYYNR